MKKEKDELEKEIKNLAKKDKSLIPEYLDKMKEKKKIKKTEIKKDNLYYKYL